MSAMIWFDYEYRQSRLNSSTQAKRQRTQAEGNQQSSPRSILYDMIKAGGIIESTRQQIVRFALKQSPLPHIMSLGATLGIIEAEVLTVCRKALLLCEGGLFARMVLQYAGPEFEELPKLLLEPDPVTQKEAAAAFLNAKVCCMKPGFGKKLRDLVTSVDEVISASNDLNPQLETVLRGWLMDDAVMTTVANERQHKMNLEALSSRGHKTHMDLDRFHATSVLQMHANAHLHRGGADPYTFCRQVRQAYSERRLTKKKARKTDSGHAGSAAFMYISKRNKQQKNKMTKADRIALMKKFAEEFKELSPTRKSVYEQAAKTQHEERKLKRMDLFPNC